MLHSRSYLHPFPARMAPDLALDAISRFEAGSTIADPMVGSGTVAMTAVAAGHNFVGFDLDPLATLIARVSTSIFDYDRVRALADLIVSSANAQQVVPTDLPWIEVNDETHKFIEFWFGQTQQTALAQIALQIHRLDQEQPGTEIDVLKVAISRIIVTKESKASLARDTSHSRPHKVADYSDFDVLNGFRASVSQLLQRHSNLTIVGRANITRGDARNLSSLSGGHCDAIVSSPPYLNAIDYLRGHKLSLVWLGYTIPQIRQLRSDSVGAERALEETTSSIQDILDSFGDLSTLVDRQRGMIARYALDLKRVATEASRILKPNGVALYVMGNSCLKKVYIDNAAALTTAAKMAGLKLLNRSERDIPSNNRYLPMPSDDGALSSRMRKEIVLQFRKAD